MSQIKQKTIKLILRLVELHLSRLKSFESLSFITINKSFQFNEEILKLLFLNEFLKHPQAFRYNLIKQNTYTQWLSTHYECVHYGLKLKLNMNVF